MRWLFLLLTAVPAAPAFAAAAPADAAADRVGDDRHRALPPEIVVTAGSRARQDVLASTSVIQGVELTRELRSSLGETLARQPGVTATSFGPNASRPILRGLGGERVRVLTDGIGSFDVSNTSEDHVVAVNPQLAERIEVLRGPATLLYGSSAIGGVVNVVDQRIPRRVPDEAVHADLFGQYGSAAGEGSVSGVLDIRLTPKLVAHFDGSHAETGDLSVGGHVLSPVARTTALASPDPAVRALADLKDRLPNTAARTDNYAGGLAYLGDRFDAGFVVSQLSTLYGVPVRFDLETGEGEQVRLAAGQTRYDVRAALRLDSGFLERIAFRAGYARYEHQELEEDGAVGTTFRANGGEARLELVQRTAGAWSGSSGAQVLARDFDAIGDEAFLPTNETIQTGLFTLQQFDLGRWKAEAGARYEHTTVRTTAPEFRGVPQDFNRGYDSVSGSIGASYGLAEGIRLGLNLSRTERAPAAEELLADGPHGGTQVYELGDRGFVTEKSLGAELTLRAGGTGWNAEASAFINRFDDFIYQTPTGAIDGESGLPVYRYLQGPARLWGLEGQAQATVARIAGLDFTLDGQADYVEVELLDGVGPAPRIPPFRFLGGAELSDDRVSARVEVEVADRQGRVAANETPTPGYTLVNASLSWKPEFFHPVHAEFVLALNNIGDVDARRSASFLKDFAPLPGRDLRLSLRLVY